MQLLETLLACADGAAARYVPTLVPALCKAVADDSAAVADGAARCCRLLARSTPAARWMPHVLEQLGSERGAARVLKAMAQASNPATLAPHAADISAALGGGLDAAASGAELQTALAALAV